jgi:predicted phosphodiesterase
MLAAIILRFRDLIADTIIEHQKLIEELGFVWWGWWRKPNEPDRLSELEQINAQVKGASLKIGLFDRSKQAFYVAVMDGCVFTRTLPFVSSPAPAATPPYYQDEKLPAWFRIRAIQSIERSDFVDVFGGVPVEDYTFYPVRMETDRPRIEPPGVIGGPIALAGETILHLTDIHFGVDFGFPAARVPGGAPLLDIISSDATAIAGRDIGLIVVSGDLTSRGKGSYLFSDAKPFLEALRTRFALGPEHVIIVPGNHDIPLEAFAVTYDHEAEFDAFLKEFYGVPARQHRVIKCTLPSGRMVEILTMSSVKLRSKETANYGWVDWQACEEVLTSLGERDPESIRVAVLHHHLVSSLRDEQLPDSEYPYGSISVTLNAGAVIEGLQRHGFRLVLHGHQHTPAVSRISRGRLEHGSLNLRGMDEALYVVAGGSAGVKGARINADVRDNAYGVIGIRGNSLEVTVRLYGTAGYPRDFFKASLPL